MDVDVEKTVHVDPKNLLVKRENGDSSREDEGEHFYDPNPTEVIYNNYLTVNNEYIPEPQGVRTRISDFFWDLKRRKTTVLYLILLLLVIAILATLLFILVPFKNTQNEISSHIQETSKLAQDCLANTQFLQFKSDDLSNKLQNCDRHYNDSMEALKKKTAQADLLQTRVNSLQQEVWDLNAKILSKNNKIFELSQNADGKNEGGFFNTVAHLFSAGSAVNPSFSIIIGLVLFNLAR